MHRTIVPGPTLDVDRILENLSEQLPTLSPELRKAAVYTLDNPAEIGLGSVREVAGAAGVKPNTMVRMAREIGFDGFEAFREPFRNHLRSVVPTFPDRARWLQEIGHGGKLGELYGGLARSALLNIEKMFATISPESIRVVAALIAGSDTAYVVGVGANYALAHNFAYLARMAVGNVVAVPSEGSLPIDDVVRAGPDDVVISLTFEPYRAEVVDATEAVIRQGAKVVAITDSRGSPIARNADEVLIISTETPQFFPSTVAAATLLETLVAFIVAAAPKEVVDSIDRFHSQRYDLGVYWRHGP